MIKKWCISKEWISDIALKHQADKGLTQKLIRALILVEGLSAAGLNFIFKGGTALMLLFSDLKRLSIDIDIIIPAQSSDLNALLTVVANKTGFNRVEKQLRNSENSIQKSHYKFYYTNAFNPAYEEFVLLDILFEEIHYTKVILTKIQSSFVLHEGKITEINTPDFNNFMGDKLTAFASNTAGIPYYKKDKIMGQEIIKQLYDIGNIFMQIDDLEIIKAVFSKISRAEMRNRNQAEDTQSVKRDIIGNCLAISLRQSIPPWSFEVLQSGIKQVSNFIFSENYYVEKATVHAARIAWLVEAIHRNPAIERYTSAKDMATWTIKHPDYSKLNKLKKTNPEAFYYWYRYFELISNQYGHASSFGFKIHKRMLLL